MERHSFQMMVAGAKAWCLRTRAEASLSPHLSITCSHGGQGEGLVPPYTRGSVSLCISLYLFLSRGPGRMPGASVHTRNRLSLHISLSLSLTGARAKAWCLRTHVEAPLSPYLSISFSHGGQGEGLVPPYTRGSVSLSPHLSYLYLTGARAKAWYLLVHEEASLSISLLPSPLHPRRPHDTGARHTKTRSQGLTLVRFPAQPEPFLTQNTPYTPPNTC
jgi:hypothetical protein